MANTTQITFIDSMYELHIKQLVPKTVGQETQTELLENRLEISPFPSEKLSDIALRYMSFLPETRYFVISLHKIEIYQDGDGKPYYSDTLIEALDSDSFELVSLRTTNYLLKAYLEGGIK